MWKTLRQLIILGLCGGVLTPAWAQSPPGLMPYEGTIVDEGGQALTGVVSAIFALYSEPVGGVPLWVEIQSVALDAGGGYVALLGATSELPIEHFASGEAAWLGVQPEGQPEQPRVMLVSVPYALQAGDAHSLGGRPASDYLAASEYPQYLALGAAGADTLAGDGGNGGGAGLQTTNDDVEITGTLGVGIADPVGLVRAQINGTLMVDDGTEGRPGFVFRESNGTSEDSGFWAPAENTIALSTNGTERLRINAAGRVGLGNVNPAARLHVTANDAVAAGVTQMLRLEHMTTGTAAAGIGAGVTFSAEDSVGGSGPIASIQAIALDVTVGSMDGALTFGTAFNGVDPVERMRISNTGAVSVNSSSTFGNVQFYVNGAMAVAGGSAGKPGLILKEGAGNSEDTGLWSPDINAIAMSTNGTERLRVDSAGRVGIGTTSPTKQLHVAGDVQVDGNLAAKYQDVAEWVEAVGDLPPGTVVVVDPAGPNRVGAAAEPYDTRVVGAVSAQPGLILGEAGPGKVMVAQSGRVLVKVDATYGAIRAGDLLVTSPTPGHAMVSRPVDNGGYSVHRPGTIVGKALDNLTAGTGKILVLLTLQ